MGRPKGSKNKVTGFIEDDSTADIVEEIEDAATLSLLQTEIEHWVAKGVPCKYARFIAAVHPAPGKDPVNEFKLESKEAKYLVNSLIYTPHGLVFGVHGEIGIVPLANISHVRVV